MKLEEIHELWSKDSRINTLDIGNESVNTPKLHGKYLQILSGERMKLRQLREHKKELTLVKMDYFMGRLDQEELKKRGWEPFAMRLLKNDVPVYMDADPDVIKINLQIGVQEEKVDVLESIIKIISNRGFSIKSYIDWKKFENGLG
jgi:hypothetical protein